MKIIFLAILMSSWNTFASVLLLEVGDTHILNPGVNKIWIENEQVLIAQQEHGRAVLKPKSLGSTMIKLNAQSEKVIVLPINTKKNYALWKQQSLRFPSLQPDIVQQKLCLTGKLSSFTEFKKIQALFDQQEIWTYLCLKTAPKLQDEIQNWYSQKLRSLNFTPYKISFDSVWKINVSQKDYSLLQAKNTPLWGLQTVLNKDNIELAENVEVEIHITEIKKEFSRSLGVSWPTQYEAKIFDFNKKNNETIETFLQAHERTGEMKIIASPRIISRSGKQSEFFAGGEFPLITLAGKENRQIVNWKKYGISLNFKPLVDSIGQMSLYLETEISTIDKSKEVQGIPALLSHKVTSYFDLIRSKTIALSGLIKNETGLSKSGLPFLSSLPLIGPVFGSQDFLENKSELVIFVTPKLMD